MIFTQATDLLIRS